MQDEDDEDEEGIINVHKYTLFLVDKITLKTSKTIKASLFKVCQ